MTMITQSEFVWKNEFLLVSFVSINSRAEMSTRLLVATALINTGRKCQRAYW